MWIIWSLAATQSTFFLLRSAETRGKFDQKIASQRAQPIHSQLTSLLQFRSLATCNAIALVHKSKNSNKIRISFGFIWLVALQFQLKLLIVNVIYGRAVGHIHLDLCRCGWLAPVSFDLYSKNGNYATDYTAHLSILINAKHNATTLHRAIVQCSGRLDMLGFSVLLWCRWHGTTNRVFLVRKYKSRKELTCCNRNCFRYANERFVEYTNSV